MSNAMLDTDTITMPRAQYEREKQIEYARGIINGVTRYAFYNGATQHVGNRGYKLADAIREVEQEYRLTEPVK